MRQRLAVVLAGAMALAIPLRASDGRKPSNDVRSALEFFEGHGDVDRRVPRAHAAAAS